MKVRFRLWLTDRGAEHLAKGEELSFGSDVYACSDGLDMTSQGWTLISQECAVVQVNISSEAALATAVDNLRDVEKKLTAEFQAAMTHIKRRRGELLAITMDSSTTGA